MGITCFGSKDEGRAATRCIGNLSTGTRSLPGSAFAFFMVMVINDARMCCLQSCRRGGCVWAATRVHSIQGTTHESPNRLQDHFVQSPVPVWKEAERGPIWRDGISKRLEALQGDCIY